MTCHDDRNEPEMHTARPEHVRGGPFVVPATAGARLTALLVAAKLVVRRNLLRREDGGGPQVRRQVTRHQLAFEPAGLGDEFG